jgi:hypothetical protein
LAVVQSFSSFKDVLVVFSLLASDLYCPQQYQQLLLLLFLE